MSARRSQGQGTLVERPPGSGRWYGRVRMGTDANGKAIVASTTVEAPSRSKADKAWQEWVATERARVGVVAPGQHRPVSYDSFADLLGDYARTGSPRWTPAGRKLHAEFIDGYLRPLHHHRPERITAEMLGDFYARLLRSGGTTRAGRQTRGGRLGFPTVDRLDTMVKAAFAFAIDSERFVGPNPAKRAAAQRWRGHVTELNVEEVLDDTDEDPGRVPEHAEVRALLDATPTVAPELYAPVVLAAHNGLRRGELLALSLTDWDSRRRLLRIAKRLSAGDEGEKLVAGTKDSAKRGFTPRVVPVDAVVAAVLDAHVEGSQLRAVAAADPEGFGALVRRQRDARGWSQADLGGRCAMSQFGISLLERGGAYQGRGSIAPGPAAMGALGRELGIDWRCVAAEGALRRNGFLFSPKPDGSAHWSLKTGSTWVPGICTDIGLDAFGLQGLRRRVSTDLVATGTQAKDLVALMGHSMAVAIRYYTDSTDLSREAAVNRLAALYRSGSEAEVLPLRRTV